MKETSPITIARKNYQPPNWTIDKTNLVFELSPSLTVVQSRLLLRRVGTGALQQLMSNYSFTRCRTSAS